VLTTTNLKENKMTTTNPTTQRKPRNNRANRIKALRASRKTEKDAINKLTNKVLEMSAMCDLDEERTARRISSATKSEYGRIHGLVNLIGSISKWPCEPGNESQISENQLKLQQSGLDLMLLEDIAEIRGHHTFCDSDSLELIEAKEPDYELYSDLSELLLEELRIKAVAPRITDELWQRNEAKAKSRAIAELEELKIAVEAHKVAMAK
jgi:hypothetical protein